MKEIKVPAPFKLIQQDMVEDELDQEEFTKLMSRFYDAPTENDAKYLLRDIKEFIRENRPVYDWGSIIQKLEPWWAFLLTVFLLGLAVLGISIGGFGIVSFIRFAF